MGRVRDDFNVIYFRHAYENLYSNYAKKIKEEEVYIYIKLMPRFKRSLQPKINLFDEEEFSNILKMLKIN